MIYARQIAPEYQDTGYFMEAYTEGEQRINVCGNGRFADYTSEDFDRVKEIVNSWEIAYVLENLSSYGYANAADAIMDYLPPMKERYTDRDIYDLNLLLTDSHGWEFEHHDNNIQYGYLNREENFLCEVLSIVYGEKWTWNVIRGSAQGDWNNVFYPVSAFTAENIEQFETLYFNEGTEWIVSDDMPADVETDERGGEIIGIETDEGEQDNAAYDIELYDGTRVTVSNECFDVERDSVLPMWGTMWQFHDPCDTYWIEEQNGIEALSQCGFRVYYSEQFGYFFGIDGCGYDFYLAHFIPLYKARGLKWHDPEADPAEYMVNEGRNQTLTGNYHFEFEEIENRFGIVVDDDMKEEIGDYVARNYGYVVAELDMSEDFDFTFYTNYCPNYEA